MKIHAVLNTEAQELLRGQSAGHLDAAGQALLGKLGAAGLRGINVQRAVRHGIVTGDLADPKLDQLRSLPEVASVEVDGVMRAI